MWKARNDLVGWGKSWLIWSDEANDVARTSWGQALQWPGKNEDSEPPADCKAHLAELNGTAKAKK